MKATGWTVFAMVVIVGGGMHYTNLGALDPDTNKMEKAKVELLHGEVTVLVEDCPVTIKPLKRSDEKNENIVLAVEMKNPSSQEKKIVFWLQATRATSSALMRVMPSPVSILNQQIEVTLPPGQTEQKEIILTAQTLPSLQTAEESKKLKPVPLDFLEVTTYRVFVNQPSDKLLSTPACTFTPNTIQIGGNNKVLVRQQTPLEMR